MSNCKTICIKLKFLILIGPHSEYFVLLSAGRTKGIRRPHFAHHCTSMIV